MKETTTSKIIGGSGPLYEQALVYQAKGSVLSWGSSNSQTVDRAEPNEGTAGIVWSTNEFPIPASNYTVPYAWNYINSVWKPVSIGDSYWVDWGDVPGDEDFLSPAVYEIKAVITSQSSGPSPVYTGTSDTDMFADFIDLDQPRRIAITAGVGTLAGGLMSVTMSVTIRQKSNHTNSVTRSVFLRLIDGIT